MKQLINTDPTLVTDIDTTKSYDGYENLTIKVNYDQTITERRKVNLSDIEVTSFLKGIDPSLYFRNGRIPYYFSKSYGDLLQDDFEEVQAMKDKFKLFDGVLMFKPRQQNLYTLLIPKKYAEQELDENGEFSSPFVNYDVRSIAFNGQNGSPTVFSKNYFDKRSDNIIKVLNKSATSRQAVL